MNDSLKPPEQRPEHPDFWCKRFGEGVTPWDAGNQKRHDGNEQQVKARPAQQTENGPDRPAGAGWHHRHGQP